MHSVTSVNASLLFSHSLSGRIAGVTLYGGARASELLKLPRASSFHIEYSALSCTVEVVKDVQAAIDHIHEHGRYDF